MSDAEDPTLPSMVPTTESIADAVRTTVRKDAGLLKVSAADGQPAESRQVQRRQALIAAKRESALTKMAEQAEAQVLGADMAEKFQRLRHMFFAYARSQGRIRIPRSDLDALEPGSSVSCTVQANGDMLVEFVKGGGK